MITPLYLIKTRFRMLARASFFALRMWTLATPRLGRNLAKGSSPTSPAHFFKPRLSYRITDKMNLRFMWSGQNYLEPDMGRDMSHSHSARPVRDPPEVHIVSRNSLTFQGLNTTPPQNFYSDTRDLESVSVAPWLIPHDHVRMNITLS